MVSRLIRMEEPDGSEYSVPYGGDVMRDHDEAYMALYASRDAVRRLMSWRRDPSPATWKWPSPVATCDARDADMRCVRVYDHQNNGWVTDAYKGKGGIILLMSPIQYRRMAFDPPPGRFENPASRRTVERLAGLFRAGRVVDSAYVVVDPDRNCETVSQEGHHRGIAASAAGIRLMPVYVYSTVCIDPEVLLRNVVTRYGLAVSDDHPVPRTVTDGRTRGYLQART